jgi:hypothetical protein
MTYNIQKYEDAKILKKFIRENGIVFIKNNERRRKELGINKRQLTIVLKYLTKTGYLELWNGTSSRNNLYKISKTCNNINN